MLSRLLTVLLRKGASLNSATRFITLIEDISHLGPCREFPHVVLGGGFLPTRDAKKPIYDPYDHTAATPSYDPEDGQVIDTAIAGRVNALVTANFRDFVDQHDTIIASGRVHIRHTAMGDLYIVQPKEMAAWLQSGQRPIPAQSIADEQLKKTRSS